MNTAFLEAQKALVVMALAGNSSLYVALQDTSAVFEETKGFAKKNSQNRTKRRFAPALAFGQYARCGREPQAV